MTKKYGRQLLTIFLAMIIVTGTLLPQSLSTVNADSVGKIWIGTNETTTYPTINAAVNAASEGDVIHISGTFDNGAAAVKNSTVNKPVTLDIAGNTTITGDGSANGITLSNKAKLQAGGNTLRMSKFKTALTVQAGSSVNDGIYNLDGNEIGFSLDKYAKLEGTARDKLKVSAMESTGKGFSYTTDARFIRCNVTVQAKNELSEQYAGLYMTDSSLTTRGVWYYFGPAGGNGGVHLDHSDFYVYKAKGSSNYRQCFSLLGGESELKNGSTMTGDGSRITVSAKLTVNDSKVVIKNSSDGGLNINYKPGEVVFNDSTLETTNMRYTPSYGTGQSNGPCYLTFTGSSVVNTDAKDKTADNGGANRGTGSTYVVTGGSFLVAYDKTYNYDVTTPTNGAANGNEWLSLFTLADTSVNVLNPINKDGKTYEYKVAKASRDGKKHVWTPAAKVTFSLNNSNAKFDDNTTAPKTVETIRGYKPDDVTGNTDPGTPKDSKGIKFLGWFYKDAAGKEHSFDWNDKVTENRDVYAKWDAKSIVYHNGKSVKYLVSVDNAVNEAAALGYEDVVKAEPNFKVNGKSFKYWTKSANGQGQKYQKGDKLSFDANTKNIDLYAQYDNDQYKVSFSANGGSFADNSVYKTNPDVFDIVKDANGGEVAVLKKKAEYGQKLRELLNGFDYNKLKPDTNAKKPGYLIADNTNWNVERSGKGKDLRFDDHSVWIFPVSGDNPEITDDTTYYLKWKKDPSVQEIKADEELPADIWGNSADRSAKPEVVHEGDKLNLTGAVDISSIRGKMKAIEGMFPDAAAHPESLKLTDPQSTFTATLTVPEGIKLPDNPEIEAKGLGDAFELGDTSVNGNTIKVQFRLKAGITDYKRLQAAIDSVGVDSPLANGNTISLTVKGLSLDGSKAADGQKLAVKGVVNGDFSAVATSAAGTSKLFNFTWKGIQAPFGKDDQLTAADKTIQYTFIASKPKLMTLTGDILTSKNGSAKDTENDKLYRVESGDSVTYTGRLNVEPIKHHIEELKNGYQGDANTIATEDVKSTFTATLTMPEGLDIPNNPVAKLTDNDLFKITEVKKDGRKIVVTMKLKKSYDKFIDLYNDVKSVPAELDVDIPGIVVKDGMPNGTLMTVKGTAEGSFTGTAVSASGTVKPYNFAWNAEQSEAGRDFLLKNEPVNKTIQHTSQLMNPILIQKDDKLDGDLLIGEDTEHTAIHGVKAGEALTYTGRLNISPIKKQISDLKDSYGGNANTIITKDIKSTFTAELTVPNDLNLADNPAATLSDNGLFTVKKVEKVGNKVIVTMTLKKDYNRFIDLYNDVTAVPDRLDLDLTGVSVKKDAVAGARYTVEGVVKGVFSGKATTEAGNSQIYDFKWTAVQTDAGRDFTQPASEPDAIRYTVEVEKKPTVEQGDNPGGNKPKPITKVKRPKTGDESNVKVMVALLLAAVVAIAVIVVYRRKHK